LAVFVRAYAANHAARAEAEGVVQRWNDAIATGADIWWSPTIRAALVAGTPWLDVYCPGCQTSRAIDIRTIDRHPMASVGSLVMGLRCSWCPGLGADAEDHRAVCLAAHSDCPALNALKRESRRFAASEAKGRDRGIDPRPPRANVR
jgi:hypothetical protein